MEPVSLVAKNEFPGEVIACGASKLGKVFKPFPLIVLVRLDPNSAVKVVVAATGLIISWACV